MSNLKIFQGSQHGPQSGETNGSPQTQSGEYLEHQDSRPKTSYSHDQTPARQRELESQGMQNRSLLNGSSNQRGNHSHGFKSGGHHHSDDLPGLRGLLNLRDGNGSSGRAESQGNRYNGRLFDGPDQPGAQTKSHGDHGDHSRGYIPGNTAREFDSGGDYQTSTQSRYDRPDGLLRTLRDTVRTELNQLRRLDNDSRSLPPGQEKRLADNVPSQHHGWEHRQSFDAERQSTLEDVFRTVNEQLRTVAHDLHKNPHGPDRWPDYANRLAYKIDYALENRVLRGDPNGRAVREIASEVRTIGQLGKYFSQLERTGGEPVRQAYRAVLDFLLGSRVGEEYDRLRFAAELLRDLQSGVFLFREDFDAPFPLTGRARVVSEMIELMRTLDAIEKFTEAMRLNGLKAEWPLLQPGGLSGLELMAVLEQLLSEQGPMFPGLMGRLEIPRLVAQLDGLLNNAEGKPLLMIDGKPLRVGDLLWLNLLTNSSTLGADRLGVKLPAPFLFGLDSVFSLIGFDGRSLSVPHFLAIQSQINAFNFDWVTGQAPLSEGWMRAVIESLKDSRIYDHNVLGEMLEEALTHGRLHLLVMRGTVENGKPVSGSCSFSPVYDLNGRVVAATS